MERNGQFGKRSSRKTSWRLGYVRAPNSVTNASWRRITMISPLSFRASRGICSYFCCRKYFRDVSTSVDLTKTMIRKVRRLPPLFAEEKSEDRDAAKPGHLQDQSRRQETRKSGAVISNGSNRSTMPDYDLDTKVKLAIYEITAETGRIPNSSAVSA